MRQLPAPLRDWICRFCGHKNFQENQVWCASCGKERHGFGA